MDTSGPRISHPKRNAENVVVDYFQFVEERIRQGRLMMWLGILISEYYFNCS